MMKERRERVELVGGRMIDNSISVGRGAECQCRADAVSCPIKQQITNYRAVQKYEILGIPVSTMNHPRVL